MNFFKCWPAIVVIVVGIVFTSFELGHAAPKKSKSTTDTASGWKKIGSRTGIASTDGVMYEIKPSLEHWRFNVTTSVSTKAGPSASGASVRIALMTCNHEDVDGKPHDWEQTALLYQGKPGGTITREFHNGLDKHGTGHWYAIQMIGQYTHFQILAEQIDDSASTQPAASDAEDGGSKSKHPKKD